jgi:thioredoxin 1
MKSRYHIAWRWAAFLGLLATVGLLTSWGCTSRPSQEPMPATGSAPTKLPSMVKHADEGNFNELVLRSDVPVLVDFYSDGCPPCRRLAPILEDFARETPHVRVVKVNIARNQRLAMEYTIESIPTLMVFKDGWLRARHAGAPGDSDYSIKDGLKSMLEM